MSHLQTSTRGHRAPVELVVEVIVSAVLCIASRNLPFALPCPYWTAAVDPEVHTVHSWLSTWLIVCAWEPRPGVGIQ